MQQYIFIRASKIWNTWVRTLLSYTFYTPDWTDTHLLLLNPVTILKSGLAQAFDWFWNFHASRTFRQLFNITWLECSESCGTKEQWITKVCLFSTAILKRLKFTTYLHIKRYPLCIFFFKMQWRLVWVFTS